MRKPQFAIEYFDKFKQEPRSIEKKNKVRRSSSLGRRGRGPNGTNYYKNINASSPYSTYIFKNNKTGLFKIGKSRDVFARRLTIKWESHCEVSIVKVWESDIESHLHNLFSDLKIKGEWFDLSETDLLITQISDNDILMMEPICFRMKSTVESMLPFIKQTSISERSKVSLHTVRSYLKKSIVVFDYHVMNKIYLTASILFMEYVDSNRYKSA